MSIGAQGQFDLDFCWLCGRGSETGAKFWYAYYVAANPVALEGIPSLTILRHDLDISKKKLSPIPRSVYKEVELLANCNQAYHHR